MHSMNTRTPAHLRHRTCPPGSWHHKRPAWLNYALPPNNPTTILTKSSFYQLEKQNLNFQELSLPRGCCQVRKQQSEDFQGSPLPFPLCRNNETHTACAVEKPGWAGDECFDSALLQFPECVKRAKRISPDIPTSVSGLPFI